VHGNLEVTGETKPVVSEVVMKKTKPAQTAKDEGPASAKTID
jgi:hypothetical protein